MRKLLLLRHGMTEANERRLFSGSLDLPLCARGRAELESIAAKMPPADLFFTSGMLRARQTLQILYGDVPSVTFPELSEYSFGVFEMRSHDDLFASEPVYRQWLGEDEAALDVCCPGGETRRAFAVRVGEGWRKLCAYSWEGLAVLVGHGGVIREIMQAYAVTEELRKKPYMHNGAGMLTTLSPEGQIVSAEAFSKFAET